MDYVSLVYQIVEEKAKSERQRKKWKRQVENLLRDQKEWGRACSVVKEAFREVWEIMNVSYIG